MRHAKDLIKGTPEEKEAKIANMHAICCMVEDFHFQEDAKEKQAKDPLTNK